MLVKRELWWAGMMLAVMVGCSGTGTDSNETRQDSETGFGNNIPVSQPQSLTLLEDEALEVLLTATDADEDTLTYSVTEPPVHGTLEGTAPDLIYHPHPDYNGADSFTFKANDGQVDSPIVSISLTITPVNDAPDTQPDSASTDEDTAVSIDVLANDSDRDVGDNIHIASITMPAHGTATIQEGKVLYSPAQDYHGVDHFSYIASDGNGGETPAEVTVTVISVNDMPVARAGEDMVIVQSETVTVDGSSSYDVDGDSLTYLWEEDGEEVSSSATFTYEGKEVGSFTLTLTVTDPEGASSSDTVTIEVTEPQNETPTQYKSTFVPQRPIISTSSGMAMDTDINQIKSEADTLIQEAEALIADKHFTLEVTPLSDAQKAAITSRKAHIEQEVQNHGN